MYPIYKQAYALKFALFLSAFLLSLMVLFGQSVAYSFQHLSIEEGLTSSQYTFYTYQDTRGFVWISSPKGLNRFDGKQVKKYLSNRSDPNALQHSFASVSPFQEDGTGILWFTNHTSLCAYDFVTDQFDHHTFTTLDGEIADKLYFWSHLDSISNHIWVSADRNLCVLDLKDPSNKRCIDSLFLSLKDKMFPRADGANLLFDLGIRKDSLAIYTYIGFERVDWWGVKHPLSAEITDVLYEGNDMLWVGTNQGLYWLNLNTKEWQLIPAKWEGVDVIDIEEIERMADGRLLIGTKKNGIYMFSRKSLTYTNRIIQYTKEGNQVFEPELVRMTVDRTGNLWVHAKDDGIYYTHLKKPKFGLAHALLNKAQRNIKSFGFNSKSQLWMLTQNSVLQVGTSNCIDCITEFELPITGTDLEQTTAIHIDKQDRVWVGTLTDLFLLKPGQSVFQKIKDLPFIGRFLRPGFNNFVETDAGDIIIAVNNDCQGQCSLLKISADLKTKEWVEPIVQRAQVIERNQKNDILIATYMDSLYLGRLTHNGALEIEEKISDLPFIADIHYDSIRNCFWIGTFNGLFQVKRVAGRWILPKQISIPQKLIISSLVLANDGSLWIADATGLVRYQPEDNLLRSFSREDGLQGSDFNIQSSISDDQGQLYFGGTKGVNIFRPNEIRSYIPKARAIITNIRVNQKSHVDYQAHWFDHQNPLLVQTLTLPYDHNNLEFQLAPLEYSAPKQCEFKYQLLGGNDSKMVWHGSDPILRFANLEPRQYTLKIWASNSDGDWSAPKLLSIRIKPHWTNTAWFYTLLIVAIITGIIGFYRRRLKRLVEAEQMKSAISNTERQLAEVETAMLRLQMNPHFIFNGMNSIYAFVGKGDRLSARTYLNKFAKLMRNILDNSEKQMHGLDEEIALLEHYLEVEQLRLGDKLTYTLDIDAALEPYDWEIPSMILQPFVENGIWHGISPLPSGGQLTIRFYTDQLQLICEVEDNGIGRSATIKNSDHKSKAINITNRRLSLLANHFLAKPSFTIHDKFDSAGAPSGTLVRFSFSQLK